MNPEPAPEVEQSWLFTATAPSGAGSISFTYISPHPPIILPHCSLLIPLCFSPYCMLIALLPFSYFIFHISGS